MPEFDTDLGFEENDRFTDGAATQSEITTATQFGAEQDRGAFATIGGALLGGVVDLVDTVSSSIPLASKGLGIDRGDFNQGVLNVIDSPGLRKFYQDTQGGVEAVSGIYGVVAAELTTRKITTAARPITNLVKKIPYVRRIATLDRQYTHAMAAVRNVDRSLAKSGTLGAAQYTGDAIVDFKKFDAATGTFQRVTQNLSRDKARRGALALGAAKSAKHAVAVETVMAVTLNQNSFLYEDDASHNLMWMGLGVAGAGALDWVGGAYQLRKFANSDEIRRTFANALDPEGLEGSRLLWHGKEVEAADQFQSYLGGVHTDEITSLLVNASQLRAAPTDGSAAQGLLTNRDRLASQHMHRALETTQKVTNKGITTDGNTRFALDTPEYGNHIRMIVNNDASGLYGAEMIGGIPANKTAKNLHDSHQARLDERITEIEAALDTGDAANYDLNKLRDMRKQLRYEKELTPVVYLDGEAGTLSEAAAIERFVEPEIQFTKDSKGPKKAVKELGGDNPHGLFEAMTESRRGRVSIDTKLAVHIPGKKTLDDADHFDILRLYRMADKAADHMAKFKEPIQIPENPSWFQLDLAEEILKRSEDQAQVRFPAGMTRETAQVESLAQKAEAIKARAKAGEVSALKAGKTEVDPEDLLSQLRVRYNLPKLTAYERGVTGQTEHAVEKLLRGIGEHGPDKVRKMSIHELKEATAQIKRIDDIAPVTAKDERTLTGNSFKYMLDDQGMPIKPLLVYKRPFQKTEWSQARLEERLAANKIMVANKLVQSDAQLTKTLSESLLNSPDFDQAARTHELLETQIQGSVVGSSQQGFLGAAAKSITSSEFRDRDNPILLAATRVRDTVDRQARAVMQRTISDSFGDTLGQLANTRNTKSQLLLNQFHSFRPGWDLATDTIQRTGPDGKPVYVFPLSDSAANKARWLATHGTEMPKGQVLVNPDGVEVALDALGKDIQDRFNQVSSVLVKEKNALLSAHGSGQIQAVANYVPPPNTNGKLIGFVLGPDNKPVAGMSIVAKTQQEFDKSLAALQPKLEEMGLGYRFRTQDEIREFATIWDKAQMDLIDPGVTAVQPKKTNQGLLSGGELKHQAFNDSLKYLQNSFLRHADDIVESLFKEQINAAKSRSAISDTLSKNRAAFNRDQKFKNIYDNYLENLTGRSKLNDEGSLVGRVFNPIEGTLDKMFEGAAPHTAKVWDALTAWSNKGITAVRGDLAQRDFDVLTKELKDYMPFKSAMEYVESKTGKAEPWKTAEIVGNINQFTAATMLRMMEVAHPIMNLAGIVNAMPAVIRSFQPKEGEDVAAFAARVGHNANIFELGDGRVIGNIDMGKIAGRAVKRAWSRESHPDYDYMVRNGYLNQEVAEFHRQFGAIESKSDFKAFFIGDESRKGFRKKGVVGWMSTLSDNSEDFSRSWGHMTGLEIADSLGIKGLEARNAFAHDIANKMIANYSPQNRPEIFQGAMGASLGLFQSFILNYYQRLFRYAETGDAASFGTQYATQGALFGATSLTGWSQFNQLFLDASEGESDPSSGIWRKFGGNGGDLIGSGVLSNLPKLFGGDAVDLYSRGDTNVRLPGFNGLPGIAVLDKVREGIGEGISHFAEAMLNENIDLSATQLAEIWSNTIPNRPIAGMIEQFAADGNDTDQYGQLIQDTQGAMEATYRIMGVRSMRQSQQINAFYANKSAMEHKAAADEVLRLNTRTSLRDGTFDDKADGIFTQYVENGGDPRNFKRWIKSSYNSATTPASQRQLKETLSNPSRMSQTQRLLDAGVSIEEDEATEDDYFGSADDEESGITDEEIEAGIRDYQSAIPGLGQEEGAESLLP